MASADGKYADDWEAATHDESKLGSSEGKEEEGKYTDRSEARSITSLDDSRSTISSSTHGTHDRGSHSHTTGVHASSTSTIIATSTITVPNNDEVILAVSTVLRIQMLSHPDMILDYVEKVGTSFAFFDDDYYSDTPIRLRKEVTEAPSVDEIYTFMNAVFHIARFSPECNIISLVYINRLMSLAGICLHSKNWRPLLLSALLIAQKVWDDKSLASIDFPVIWRHAVPAADASLLNIKAINNFESKFLELISFNVTVSPTLYAQYYFELRGVCEADSRRFALKPLTKSEAARLEGTMVMRAAEGLKTARSAFTVWDMKSPTRSRAVIS